MNITEKIRHRNLRKSRIRARVTGTPERPRLTVFIGARHVSAQIIDDTKGVTLAASHSKAAEKGNLTERAAWVGEDIAQKAIKAKLKKVVLDRNGRLYHGRIKALADAARTAGLEL